MKILKHVDGNLLTNKDVMVIGHQANCQNTFGSGIALTIKQLYPEAYRADCTAAISKLNTLGRVSYANIALGKDGLNHQGTKLSRIYNLYGQNLGTDYTKKFDRKTNYEALYCALEEMACQLRATEADKAMFDYNREPVVGFPYKMGSDRGGGSWDVVERLIEDAFTGYESDVIIVHFK